METHFHRHGPLVSMLLATLCLTMAPAISTLQAEEALPQQEQKQAADTKAQTADKKEQGEFWLVPKDGNSTPPKGTVGILQSPQLPKEDSSIGGHYRLLNDAELALHDRENLFPGHNIGGTVRVGAGGLDGKNSATETTFLHEAAARYELTLSPYFAMTSELTASTIKAQNVSTSPAQEEADLSMTLYGLGIGAQAKLPLHSARQWHLEFTSTLGFQFGKGKHGLDSGTEHFKARSFRGDIDVAASRQSHSRRHRYLWGLGGRLARFRADWKSDKAQDRDWDLIALYAHFSYLFQF